MKKGRFFEVEFGPYKLMFFKDSGYDVKAMICGEKACRDFDVSPSSIVELVEAVFEVARPYLDFELLFLAERGLRLRAEECERELPELRKLAGDDRLPERIRKLKRVEIEDCEKAIKAYELVRQAVQLVSQQPAPSREEIVKSVEEVVEDEE